MSDSVELPIMHWFWLTAISGIVSNIGWELFNYFGHATMHSFASAWHEFKKLPSHVLSVHAPFRVVGVVSAALAVISLVQSTGGFQFGVVPLQILDAYRSFAYGIGDSIFAAIINPGTRHFAYDLLIAGFLFFFVIWRTATGWRNYSEFQSAQGAGATMSFGTYFGLQILGGIVAVAIALAMIERN